MSTPLVEARGLGKRYPVLGHRGDRASALWDVLRGRPARRHVSVLEGVDFSVRPGESLAIIGENGAGKSTLLKLVTGVLTPSAGSVHTRGRVGALLELGAGFHPELSGRDNVRLSAALHGLDAKALAAKLPEIEAFADIGSYLDEPVKHYSSGMVVRLGFAIIAAVRPALLVTDEVLAVGDEAFQRKCIRWLDDYLAGGGTLLLVSHSLYHVRKLCRRALWLQHGRVRALGDVFEVSQAYEAAQAEKSAGEAASEAAVVARVPGEASIAAVRVNGDAGDGPVALGQGAALRCEIELSSRDGRPPVAMLGWLHADGTPVYGVSSEMDGAAPEALGDGRFRFVVDFPALPLLPGRYRLRTIALDAEGLRLFDQRERELAVTGESREFGLVRLPHAWRAP
ncbi:MAG: ABC transporter ATP-binding protein [Rhizobium sp.]|nr:ABC transporter ATP-binding protein [Rhizobium sp.]